MDFIIKKFIEIQVPIYYNWINIFINYSDEEVWNKCLSRGAKTDNSALKNYISESNKQGACSWMSKYGNIFIRFNFNPDVQIISHESFHVAVALLRHIKVPFNEDTEEVYAYLIGWINDAVLNSIYKNASI